MRPPSLYSRKSFACARALSAPSNAAITDGQGVGTILDNEPRISINNVSMKEGNGNGNNTTSFVFTVTMSAEGRYSVMFDATMLANGCTPPQPKNATIGPGPNTNP